MNQTASPEKTSVARLRILLVEDDPDDVYLVKDLLSWDPRRVYDITHVRSLADLPDHLNDHYDVLLLDLGLPDSSGLDTLKRALQLIDHTPILVFTGAASEMLGEKAIALGAQDYLVKGKINTELLTKAMAYAIERHAMMHAAAGMVQRDPVTNLPNTHALYEKLSFLIQQFPRTQVHFALAYIGIDNLKSVAEYWGDSITEELLRRVGARLTGNQRASDLTAVIDDQAFALLLVNCQDPQLLQQVTEKKLEMLSAPYLIDLDKPAQEIELHFSIGISPYSEGLSADKLLAQAKEAYLQAKQRHQRNTVRLNHPS